MKQYQKISVISVLLGILHSKITNKTKYSLILPSDHHIPNRNYSNLINKNTKKSNWTYYLWN